MLPPTPPKHRRCAFTLAELVAVLAVLAILAGMAWPRLLGMLTRSELVESGKRIRNALVQTRLRAIESGQPWIFRFTPGSGRFEVLPAQAALGEGLFGVDQADYEPPAGRHSLTATVGHPAGNRPSPLTPLRQTLAGGVIFDNSQHSAPAELDLTDALQSPRAPDMGTSHAPEPVKLVFQANGRAPDARIVLVAPDGRRLEVAFRGLTGTATLGRPIRPAAPTSPEDQSPLASEAKTLQPVPVERTDSASPDAEEAFWSDFAGEEEP